ncbi:MAG: hypothetical protein GWM90_04445, partial [Gemmatimonadetes bacterium]|nr:hypothetical protein [Gemmatimonadota bacterium]NIQ52927.1 hypothetical protein [Gemmatimonadota bacterium]NIU73063.1 hypothetical protein [Gammaproteobacteria bacterium]NIX43396.1 hypothetical protein [Gemmatimonadota bacterium]NIY07572.1 hypothetical protein [Gemmatimonadota bacterium]
MRLRHLAPLAILLLPGCRETADTLDEAAEVVVEGGVERLREPIRAPVGPPRVLVFALDGVGEGALREALEAGALPTLGSLLG